MVTEVSLSSETKKNLLVFALCLGITLVVFGSGFFGSFVFDDRGIVEHQALLSNIHLLPSILSLPYWTQAAGLYRPITLLSYALNFWILGPSAVGFHLINLLLYAAIGFLLYLLIEKLFRNKIIASLATLFFLLLPIHTEVVANITGRSELLALFFSLLCFLALLKEYPTKRFPFSLLHYWPAGAWFLLAIGSKETAIAALPIAAVMVLVKRGDLGRGDSLRSKVLPRLPAVFWLSASGFVYFTIRYAILGPQYFLHVATSIVENPLYVAPFLPRIFTALGILWLYIQKCFLPITLCSDYSFNQLPVVHTFLNISTLLGASILAWLIVSIIIFFKRAPIIALGSAFFLFSFLPVANLFFPTGTIMGERLMFYPSVGLALYFSFVFYHLYQFIRRKRKAIRYAVLGAFAVLLAFYAVRSFVRSLDWLTEKALFTSAAACAPNSVLSTSNLGAEYYLEGNLPAAQKELERSYQIYDGYPKGLNNLGLVYLKEGDDAKARTFFLKAIDVPFPYYGAYENLALMALGNGDTAQAKKWLLQFFSGNAAAANAYIAAYQNTTTNP